MDSQGPRPFDFMKGYPLDARGPSTRLYQNLGYGTSPYPGKQNEGDYGPTQAVYSSRTGEYYNVINPTYYVPMDTTPCVYDQDVPPRLLPKKYRDTVNTLDRLYQTSW